MTVTVRALQEIWGKQIKRFFKTVTVGADVTFCGRVFHSQEAATGKAR